MDRDIKFNGRSLQSFGFYLTKDNPISDFGDNGLELTSITGANNGDILTGFESWKNVEKTYTFKTIPSKIPYDDAKFLKVFIDWLQSNRTTYYKLEDTSRKGYFRKAFLKDISGLENPYKGCYKVSLTFSCKPFYYSDFGQLSIETSITGNTLTEIPLYNPEVFTAYPIINVKPSRTGADGGFQIRSDNTLTFLEFSSVTGSSVTIDSENKKISNWSEAVSGTVLPEFHKGDNVLYFKGKSGTSYDITILPCWRCL